MQVKQVIQLLIIHLLMSLVGMCTKWASGGEFLSGRYILGLVGAVSILGCYAIWWQQALKKIPLTTAYIFRGVGVIYGLLIAALVFGETITVFNCIGSALIIIGITIFAKA